MSQKIVHAENLDNFVTKTEVDHFEYVLDYADRNPNNESVGTSPTGLLAAALAGCYVMTARSFFLARKIDFSILKVKIVADFDHKNYDWRMSADTTIQTDAKLDDREKERLDYFIKNHCTVSNILSHGNTLNTSFDFI